MSAVAARRAKAQATAGNGNSEEAVSRNESAPMVLVLEEKNHKQDAQDAPQVQDSVNSTLNSGPQESILKLDETVPSSS